MSGLEWILIGGGLILGVICLLAMGICILRKRNKRTKDVQMIDQQIREDQQIEAVDEEMIDLETDTIEITA